MSKYRKKPVKVEAVQFDGTNESVECILQQAGCEKITRSCDILFIETPVGTKSVTIGDYIIIDINGELNTYKPDIFHKSFEKIIEDDDVSAFMTITDVSEIVGQHIKKKDTVKNK